MISNLKFFIAVFSFSLVLSGSVFAALTSVPNLIDVNKTCIGTYNIRESLTYIENDNGTLSDHVYIFDKICPDGCSVTLSSCRPNSGMQVIYGLGFFIFLMGIAILPWNESKTIGYVCVASVALGSIIIASTDIFVSPWRYLFVAIPVLSYAIVHDKHIEGDDENE